MCRYVKKNKKMNKKKGFALSAVALAVTVLTTMVVRKKKTASQPQSSPAPDLTTV